MADAIVLVVLFCVLTLIVRGMLRGRIRACDGDCTSCAGGCASPRLQLSDEQLAQLAEIDKRSGIRP